MFSEQIDVQLMNKNELVDVKLILYEELPGNEQVMLEIYYVDQVIRKGGDNYFEALQAAREELEQKICQILCNGAAENVYPSPMQMSMGNCRQAYILKYGQRARMSDLVDIFARNDCLLFTSVKNQKEYYYKWLKSF